MTTDKTTHYNIGSVSRLTGISREKIRIWERRYGAVEPERDETNLRKYSQQDVERLILIRRLVDSGQAISNVANLSLSELQARLQRLAPKAEAGARPRSALAISEDDPALRDTLADLGIPSVAYTPGLAQAEDWLAANPVDLITAEFPALLTADLPAIHRLRKLAPDSRLLVIYRFAPTPVLNQLQTVGIRAIKAPLQAEDLNLRDGPPTHRAHSDRPEPGRSDYRQRQFSPQELARLSSLAQRIHCECPRHLADLVRDLIAFEDYSLSCETTSAADAAVHSAVYDIVARARALVEDALAIVAAEEAIAP